MKVSRLIYTSLLAIWSLILCSGCQYDTPASLWDPAEDGTAASASISQVLPENGAEGGMNEIEIRGSNFNTEIGGNVVYFNNLQAELISAEPTKLVVYRPNIAGEVTIKVVVEGALLITEFSPYTVTSVLENYTEEFDDTGDIRNFAIGNDGTYYAIMRSRTLRRRTPGSEVEELNRCYYFT